MAALNFSNYRRLVVKVGSSLLVDKDGRLDRSWLQSLADDVAALSNDGHELLVVSSGAVAIGCAVLDINKKRARLEDLQAAAATGQIRLMHAYQEALRTHGISTAQVLLTPEDTENRRRFLNARGTLNKLLERRVVPVINENDTVATEEIRYGDNDRLAARIAQLVMADGLILLSDVDGLYTADPGACKDASHIPVVETIDEHILSLAGETRSDVGTGGMATKVQAASIAAFAGCTTVVASGANQNPLHSLAMGARHTVFQAAKSPAVARKQWLAGALEAKGTLRVDKGAVRALREGSSLLPVGLLEAVGDFNRGDVVSLVDTADSLIGRGLAEYSGAEARKVVGLRSDDIEGVLGYRGRSVMVHRDELVILDND